MATLTLVRPNIGFDPKLTQATALIDWLNGQWGLVFSHAQDFASLDLEADRWRDIVAGALQTAQVRALRLQSPEQRFGSWIEQIDAEDALLVLERRKRVSSDDISARAAALRSVLARTSGRFVAIVDERMQLRHVFTYSLQRVPSVLDIVASVSVLREKARAEVPTEQPSAKIVDLPWRQKAPANVAAWSTARRRYAY